MKIIKQNIKIPPLTGKKTIARADDVFTGYIDSDFENWDLDKVSGKTQELTVVCREMTEDVTFKQLFTNPEEMAMTQEQIIWYCTNHKDLLHDWYTLFLFKVGDDFFVAGVYWRDRRLEVYVNRLSNDHVWFAEYRHRFVTPQLAVSDSPKDDALSLGNSDPLQQAIEVVKEAGYIVIKII